MPEIHIHLTEQLYNQAKRKAVEAGFSSVDEYIIDVVSGDVAPETEDLDHRFTPKVMEHLNQIQDEIKTGAKIFSEEELDNYLQESARVRRKSHAN